MSQQLWLKMHREFSLETLTKLETATAQIAALLADQPDETRAVFAQYIGRRIAASLEEAAGPHMALALAAILVEGWLATAAVSEYAAAPDGQGALSALTIFEAPCEPVGAAAAHSETRHEVSHVSERGE